MGTSTSKRLPLKCEFCAEDTQDSAVRLDVRKGQQELRACNPCYEYLLAVINMDDPLCPNGCLVCLSPTEDSGTRFRLCDRCWEDINQGRRVLMKDGQSRTPPTELLTGNSRPDMAMGCGDQE